MVGTAGGKICVGDAARLFKWTDEGLDGPNALTPSGDPTAAPTCAGG